MVLPDLVKVVIAQSVITIFALAVGYIKLNNEIRKFRAQKKFDLSIERIKSQLSEFYGPMYMMTKATRQIADTAWGSDIWERVFREIVIPSQMKVEEILLAKIHLLDDQEIPPSYFDFLHHVRVARSYAETGLNPEYFKKGAFYPQQFDKDVEEAYDRKRKEYIEFISSA